MSFWDRLHCPGSRGLLSGVVYGYGMAVDDSSVKLFFGTLMVDQYITQKEIGKSIGERNLWYQGSSDENTTSHGANTTAPTTNNQLSQLQKVIRPNPTVSRQDKMESDQETEVNSGDLSREEEATRGRETGPLADIIGQLAAALAQARTSDLPGAVLPPFDGSYSARQFFQAYDRKMDDTHVENPDKLLRLPNYLTRQPLELFRKLRLATQSYFQVRQILLDLYPESSEASFAKYFAMKLAGQADLVTYCREKTAMGLQLELPQEVILETLTEGLPFSDQRLVRVVPPESIGEWFRLAQRIHGPNIPTARHREEQPPTMSGPYPSTPRRTGAWTAPTPPSNYASLIKNHQPSPSGDSSLTIDHNGLHTVSRKGVTKILIPKHSSTNYYKQYTHNTTTQLTKRPLGPTYGELGQPPEAKGPFDLLSLDTIAGFAKYGNTKIYLHVVVDHFSRYTWTFPSKFTSITTYQQVLERVLQDGSPKRLLTDRAPAFTSPKFSSFLLNRSIHPLLTTSNNPQANGLCERLNAILTGKLRLLHLENPKVAWTKTISRRLVANGLHSCRSLRRLPLTPPNRRQRLEWCRARSTWMTKWHKVVFSDESRFCLSSDSRRVRVWRRRGERSNPAAIVERPTVRQRHYDGPRYVDDVLRPVTLPYLQGVPNALYQQDNARPHTARISQQALQDVQILPWPPYSPDLSPIEHVWDIIGRRLHALPQPRSEDELWQMLGVEVSYMEYVQDVEEREGAANDTITPRPTFGGYLCLNLSDRGLRAELREALREWRRRGVDGFYLRDLPGGGAWDLGRGNEPLATTVGGAWDFGRGYGPLLAATEGGDLQERLPPWLEPTSLSSATPLWSLGDCSTPRLASRHPGRNLAHLFLLLSLPGPVSFLYGEELGLRDAVDPSLDKDKNNLSNLKITFIINISIDISCIS
ncbi:hypothetical protein LAZ67_21002364 [Cordylochernes scorpioides]|uniref:Integrase catalytic domain-containing protein n=1 Tax=Cordylochernes scorpioides TaxID=51811 RepID=A0ABY6LQQ7_9ARAC|nr:hypothetical protein LAZ67_21002364 [Cordylochernes scorpioides]